MPRSSAFLRRATLALLALPLASPACSSSGDGPAPLAGEPSHDAEVAADSGTSSPSADAASEGSAGQSADATAFDATTPDASTLSDAGRASDAGTSFDGPSSDARPASSDAGTAHDATADAKQEDASSTSDAAKASDAGQTSDAGDASVVPGPRIVGRTVPGTAGPRFEWSGTNITARFTGTQISIQLSDASNANEFEIVVDGAVQPNLVTSTGTTIYPLATGLANGTHEVVVWRRTEASYGFTEFLGFTGLSAGGALLAPPAPPAHQVEVIGDSISCGFGIEGTASCTNAQLESIENNYLAYGSIAARSLGADVVTVAWSGIGVYRNFNEVGPSTNTMPDRYDFAIPTTSTLWDFSQYQPGAVVINLTSNDFSTFGDPGQPYIDTFVTFVRHIRSKYPSAYFFLVIEWRGNGSDSGPDVDAVVSAIQGGGDSRIEAFDIRPFANGNGCQGHPDVAGGQSMGTALAAEVKRVLGW